MRQSHALWRVLCLFVFSCYFVPLFCRPTLCVLRSFASATTDGIDADPTLFQISKQRSLLKDCLYCTCRAKLMFRNLLFPGHTAVVVDGMETRKITSDFGVSRCIQNAKPPVINFHYHHQSRVRQVSPWAYAKLFHSVFLARCQRNQAPTRSSTFIFCVTHLWVPTGVESFAWWRPG